MTQMHQQRHWLALFAAILLLMQSFAVWHDAEHAFHHTDEQCERFEVYSHAPTLDVITSFSLSTFALLSVETFTLSDASVTTRQRDAYAIRAPPHTYI